MIGAKEAFDISQRIFYHLTLTLMPSLGVYGFATYTWKKKDFSCRILICITPQALQCYTDKVTGFICFVMTWEVHKGEGGNVLKNFTEIEY